MKILLNKYSVNKYITQKYINEHDAVREVLMALQGRSNIMTSWLEDENGISSFIVS